MMCASVYMRAVTPIILRTMMSRLQRNIVAAGVIAKASNRTAIDQMPDQNVNSPSGVIPNAPVAAEYSSERAGPTMDANVTAFSPENLRLLSCHGQTEPTGQLPLSSFINSMEQTRTRTIDQRQRNIGFRGRS